MQERRKFERISIPESAKLFAEDGDGKRLGPIRELGRGGIGLETSAPFTHGETYSLVVVDLDEDIRRPVQATVRHVEGNRIGFEFHNLELDAAVEIGVLIGKFYLEYNQ